MSFDLSTNSNAVGMSWTYAKNDVAMSFDIHIYEAFASTYREL